MRANSRTAPCSAWYVSATAHQFQGFLHGGLIAALADNAMGLSCGQALARDGLASNGLVTVSLSVDYLGKAQIGDWLAFDTTFVRPGRTLCFAEAQITADGEPGRGRGPHSELLAAAGVSAASIQDPLIPAKAGTAGSFC